MRKSNLMAAAMLASYTVPGPASDKGGKQSHATTRPGSKIPGRFKKRKVKR